MYAFDLHRPKSVAEAAALLRDRNEAKLIAGGQTLIPTLRQRLAAPQHLVDLASVGGLASIELKGKTLVIGAMATHGAVAASAVVQKAIPALAELAALIGDPAVRVRGTLGGSLANNDPSADHPAAVLALAATVFTNKRAIKADDFFTGLFETALEADEIIERVEFPLAEKAGYAKFRNPASRFALTAVFVAKNGADVRVAVTGAGEGGVFRAKDIEAALGKRFDAAAAAGVAVRPAGLISDVHGGADYRAHLISVMAGRAVAAAR
jgi:aerobic carbon-monoxide dehydrogenase medium subunit